MRSFREYCVTLYVECEHERYRKARFLFPFTARNTCAHGIKLFVKYSRGRLLSVEREPDLSRVRARARAYLKKESRMKLSRKHGRHNVTARVSFPFRDEGTHRPVLIAGRINESRAALSAGRSRRGDK